MKKTAFILLIVSLLAFGCSKEAEKPAEEKLQNTAMVSETAEPIRVAFFSAPPHIWMDSSGKMQGALYDLLENHIFPVMNVEVEWEKEPSTIPRQVETLQNGSRYIAALLTKSPEREGFSIYKDAFFLSQSSIVVKGDNPLTEITSVSDVSDLTIGYAEKSFITPFLRDDSVTFELVGDPNFHEINFGKLMRDRISAVYAPDKAGLLAIMKQMDLESQLKILDLPERPAGFYTVFSKDLADLSEAYAKAFDKIDGEKQYLKLLSIYLDTSKL